MAKKAYIFLAEGFEESEALVPYDILVRGGVDVTLVSISNSTMVTSAHHVTVVAHTTLFDIHAIDGLTNADLLMLPGGMPGSTNLCHCQMLRDELLTANKSGKMLAAICAAPFVLGSLGLLKGKQATCYPGFEKDLEGATATGEQVVVDGNIVTGIGGGAAAEFGLTLLSLLTSDKEAEAVKQMIIMK